MKSLVTCVALSVVICVLVFDLFSVKAATSGPLRPIALWPAAAGGLYVLDRTRGLTYIPGGAGLDVRNASNFATFSASWLAVDMTAVQSGSGDRVYVILDQETNGMLMCYSNRQFENSWIAKTILNGITPDPQGNRVFISGGLTNDVYVFDLTDPHASPTKLFVTVHGSQSLGPLAFDSDHHVLYAADERTGLIFAVDSDSKTVSRVTQISGQPSALAFDSIHRTLYIADSVGRKIWAFAVDKKVGNSEVFSASPDFREPSAIAIDARGVVWLGDTESQAIYQLIPKGVSTTYHLVL